MIGLILYDGNSLTCSRGGVTAYPDMIQLGIPSAIVAGNGSTTEAQDALAYTTVDPLPRPGAENWVVFWEGANDLIGGATVDEAIQHLAAYCAHRRAAGWQVMLVTLLPRSSDGTPDTYEASRQAVNVWLRARWADIADMLVDVGADPCMGHAGQELDERFYQADRVHLNGYGARTVAGLVAAALYAQHLGLWTEA